MIDGRLNVVSDETELVELVWLDIDAVGADVGPAGRLAVAVCMGGDEDWSVGKAQSGCACTI